MAEQNRKTLRSFYCRDYLWELFEVMTRDLGCSMDYLVNEAMRHYARSRNYSLTTSKPKPSIGEPLASSPLPGAAPPEHSAPYPGPAAQPPRPPAPPPPPPPPPAAYDPYGRAPSAPAAPPMAYPPAPADPRYPPPPAASRPQAPPLPPPASYAPPNPPAPQPQSGVPYGAPGSSQPHLYLVFNGQKHLIDKEKFIIGRGSNMTDLTIRDGNISRKHAAIIYRGGKYFLKDLDSTNGIDYQGSRIDSKRVEEGDIFHICDYELRFTYEG